MRWITRKIHWKILMSNTYIAIFVLVHFWPQTVCNEKRTKAQQTQLTINVEPENAATFSRLLFKTLIAAGVRHSYVGNWQTTSSAWYDGVHSLFIGVWVKELNDCCWRALRIKYPRNVVHSRWTADESHVRSDYNSRAPACISGWNQIAEYWFLTPKVWCFKDLNRTVISKWVMTQVRSPDIYSTRILEATKTTQSVDKPAF